MSTVLCFVKSEDTNLSVEMNVHGTMFVSIDDECIAFTRKDIEQVEALISALQEWVKHVSE